MYSFGLSIDYLTFPIINLGNSIRSLKLFLEGKSIHLKNICYNKLNFLNYSLFSTCKIKFLIGLSALNRNDSKTIIKSIQYFLFKNKIENSVGALGFINPFLGCISTAEIGLISTKNSSILHENRQSKNQFIYLTEIYDFKNNIKKDDFLILHGSFKESNLMNVKLILPNLLYTERIAYYLNIEGRLRFTKVAIIPSNLYYTEAKIFYILNLLKKINFPANFSKIPLFTNNMQIFNKIINYNNLFIKNFNQFEGLVTKYCAINVTSNNLIYNLDQKFGYATNSLFFPRKLINSPFVRIVNNYYTTEVVSRNSKILNLCGNKFFISSFSKNIQR